MAAVAIGILDNTQTTILFGCILHRNRGIVSLIRDDYQLIIKKYAFLPQALESVLPLNADVCKAYTNTRCRVNPIPSPSEPAQRKWLVEPSSKHTAHLSKAQ
jgi:hypothetical protein